MPMPRLTVAVLRELFRNFQAFRVLYETEGIDEVVGPDGATYSLWDVAYLYDQVRSLPRRQRQAIQFCLIENYKESDAARIMGVSPTNPVAKYATAGMETLVNRVRAGALPGFTEHFIVRTQARVEAVG